MSYLKQHNDGLLRFEVDFDPKTTSYLLAAYERSSGEYKWYQRICGRQYQCWKTGKLFGEAFPSVCMSHSVSLLKSFVLSFPSCLVEETNSPVIER